MSDEQNIPQPPNPLNTPLIEGRFRAPTQNEELKGWKDLAWRIDLHRKVTMNHAAVVACLDQLSAWVAAHSDHNGERSEEEIQQNVIDAFWKHLVRRDPKPLPPKRGPGRPKKNQSEDD
jgi:hypothetical protein